MFVGGHPSLEQVTGKLVSPVILRVCSIKGTRKELFIKVIDNSNV